MKSFPIKRRTFLQTVGSITGGIAGILTSRSAPVFAAELTASDTLKIGAIGVANRARANINGCQSQHLVALCDVDQGFLNAAAKDFPKSKLYSDFRKMIEKEKLDAVIVSTADHTHAPATAMALRAGLHVYCEKPLTHRVSEARVIAELTREHKRVTQMGTQIHAGSNYRRVVEWVQSGAIGAIREVHVWVGSSWTAYGVPTDTPPTPEGLDWDLWLGPAKERPYHPLYHPFQWRRWWSFGGGAMADMACHHLDLSFWALGLDSPSTVEATGPTPHPEAAPAWMQVRYEFPEKEFRGKTRPGLELTWYDGGKRPALVESGKVPNWGAGTLFVGEKGMILADYSNRMALPVDDFKDFEAPQPYIEDSIGHHEEWIHACKTGGPTTCNFDYAGRLTETVLLGAVSYRSGSKLEWDYENMKAKGNCAADEFIHHNYRSGWEL
jgi:predicted dehydrogenase